MEAKEILKQHIAKTVALTDEQFGYFFSHFKPLSFHKGQVIISEGDKVEQEYFVLSGCLKARLFSDETKYTVLSKSLTGRMIRNRISEAISYETEVLPFPLQTKLIAP